MVKNMRHEMPNYKHPMIDEAQDLMLKGKMPPQEFVRVASLLGMNAEKAYALVNRLTGELGRRDFLRGASAVGAAGVLAACDSGGGQKTVEKAAEKASEAVEKVAEAVAPSAPQQVLRISMPVQEMTDPASFSWVEKSNVSRHVVEYMTVTGPDNVTRPYLAASWSASDDLKIWTFNLRKGVKWNNGDEFNADDVVHNITRWLDPATGSSNLGLFDAMVEQYETGETDEDGKPKTAKRMVAGAVEKVDSHTVRLHLKGAALAMPENFYNYPTAIVHRGFGKDYDADLSKTPIGTGPYTLAEHSVGEKSVLRRRDGYWGDAPLLEEIQYIDHGSASDAQMNAMASGLVDTIYSFDISAMDQARALEVAGTAKILEAPTAQTGVMRMQISQKPFDDPRVRKAIVLCADNSKYPDVAYSGRGVVGENHHVAPIHPEYFALPKLKQDHAQAKALLADAGYADGLDMTIDVGNTQGAWEQQACELLAQQCAPAGINIKLNVMPAAKYWEVWDKTGFGLTSWTHRPLGTMVLSLGYRKGVPWNETHYASDEFDNALSDAEAILDVEQRRKAMEKVESIIQGDNIMVQPLWRSVFTLVSTKVNGRKIHPTFYHQFNKVSMSG